MAAQLRLDQTGLSAGVAGKSRTDGLDTGAQVTVTNTGAGSTTLIRLRWVPVGDTTAVASLAVTGNPKVWTFTPTASVYGTYEIELVENLNLPSQITERRVLVVRTPNKQLVIPSLNESGDFTASLLNAGPTPTEAAVNNAEDYDSALLNAIPYAAWWRAQHELIMAFDALVIEEGGDDVATGDADGFLSLNLFVHPSSTRLGDTVLGVVTEEAPTWTTPDDIPPGNKFRVVLCGPGIGGGGGSSANGTSARTGSAAGAAPSRIERWYSRRDLINALPITWSLPLGGAGGAGAVGSGNQTGSPGSLPANDAVVSPLLTAYFGGASVTPAVASSQGSGGGGGQQGRGIAASGSNGGEGGPPLGGTTTSAASSHSLFGGGFGSDSAQDPGTSHHGGTGGGGVAATTAVPRAGGASHTGPTGGGGGGGINNSAATPTVGAPGGARLNPDQAGAAAGVDGDDATVHQGGMGGGGGGGVHQVAAGIVGNDGGDGGLGGGGGGGGGTVQSEDSGSNTAGAGGKGGDALGIIEAYR